MWENETAADAAPAVQMGNEIVGCFYLLGPSIHLGQPASRPAIHPAAAAGKRTVAVSIFGGGEPPEATMMVPTRELLSFPNPTCHLSPDEDDLVAEALQGRKRLTSLGSHAAQWLNTERLSYPGQPAGSVLVYALYNSVTLVSTGEHGCLSLHSGAITFWAQLCLCFTRSRSISPSWGEQMQKWEFLNKESCCSTFKQTGSRWVRLSLNSN